MCTSCQNGYHYECLKQETWITKKDIEKTGGKLMCNIGQPCFYLRKQDFVTKWLKQYAKH